MTVDPAMQAQPNAQHALLDSLLYSVSHDLRSPLLTMTLSAELVETSLQAAGLTSDGVTVAVSSLKQGAADMERMLQTLMLLSRAGRRAIEPSRGALSLILGGHEVTPADLDPRAIVVGVDPLQVREMLDAVAGDDALAVDVCVEADEVVLAFTVSALEHGPTPLHAVASSLKQYAGTPVEALAVGQILLERTGGAVLNSEKRVTVQLPCAEAAA